MSPDVVFANEDEERVVGRPLRRRLDPQARRARLLVRRRRASCASRRRGPRHDGRGRRARGRLDRRRPRPRPRGSRALRPAARSDADSVRCVNELIQLSDEVRAALDDGRAGGRARDHHRRARLPGARTASRSGSRWNARSGRRARSRPRSASSTDASVSVSATDELARFDSDARKLGPRDLAACAVAGDVGATTVGGVLAVARSVGIRFMGTGGIGGVHRGYPTPPDVSADLVALVTSPVLVTCSGAKSLLDIPATMEYLETLGIPVLGYRTDTLPLFYAASGGPPVPQRVDDVETAARTAAAHWQLGGLRASAHEPAAGEHRGRRTDRGGRRRKPRAGRIGTGRDPLRPRPAPRALGRAHARGQPRARRRERPARRRRVGSVRRPVSLYDAVRDLPLAHRRLLARGPATAGQPRVPAQDDRRAPPRRRRGGHRRGRHLRRRPSTTGCRSAGRRFRSPARGRSTRSRSTWRRSRSSTPLRSSLVLPRLPQVGIRERSARSRASAGGHRARRRGRTGATRITFVVSMSLGEPPSTERFAGSGSTSTRVCGSSSTRTPSGRTRSSPNSRRPAPSTRSTSRVTTRARPSTRRPMPTSTAASPKGCPRRGWRTRRSPPRRPPVLEPHRDRVTWDAPDPLRRGHRVTPVAAEDRQREAVALRLDRAPVRRVRLLRGERNRRVRRRPVGARPGPRAHPAPRRALPSGHAERRRAARVQSRPPARLAGEPTPSRSRARPASSPSSPATPGSTGSRRPRSAEATRASRCHAHRARARPSRS